MSELRPQARGRGWEHLEYIGGIGLGSHQAGEERIAVLAEQS